jgi:hypothetical protein
MAEHIPLHTSRQTFMNQQLSSVGSMLTPADSTDEQDQQLAPALLLHHPILLDLCVTEWAEQPTGVMDRSAARAND